MQTVNAIAEILRKEGIEYLVCFPSNNLLPAATAAGLRVIVARQERTGVHIADGYSRVTNGRRLGAFTCQNGPGTESAFGAVAMAYNDNVPILLLPFGFPRNEAQFFPNTSVRVYDPITKGVETITATADISAIMRRAFSQLKMGIPGPVAVEIPRDISLDEVDAEVIAAYEPVTRTISPGNPDDVKEAAKVLVNAQCPVILAGQGVLMAEASTELVELAERLQTPVMTTLEGKSAFPENHPLSLGTAGNGILLTEPAAHFLSKSDVLFSIGSSLAKGHTSLTRIPEGKVIIHANVDPRDINMCYRTDYPIIGDAQLVLNQLIDAVKRIDETGRQDDESVRNEVTKLWAARRRKWKPSLTSQTVPINPYRVIWDLMQTVDPREAVVTHDSGGVRGQIAPQYLAISPHDFIGFGKSHALGQSLGLIIGAKLAAPEKFCINFMGDGAFGQTGLDFETAVRCGIPITTMVLNNSVMSTAIRASGFLAKDRVPGSPNRHLMEITMNYADMGRAMGGYGERIEDPEEIAPAIRRARNANEKGQAALLEFISAPVF